MPLPIIRTLADEVVREMLELAQERNASARKQDASNRILIEQENYKHLIQQQINRRYETRIARDELSKYVTTVWNPQRKIADRVLQAYKRPPRRTLEGAIDADNEAWQKLMADSHFDVRASTFTRWAWTVNVAISVPVVRQTPTGPRLTYDLILPNVADVYTNLDDPLGDPAILIYEVSDASDFTDDPVTRVALDSEAWRYFDRHGQEIVSRRVEHGLGVFPGTLWRLENPIDDWWLSHRGARVVDATLAASVTAAAMSAIRKAQNRKMSMVIAESLKSLPENQIFHHEVPIEVEANPSEIDFRVEDMMTSVDEFLKEIDAYYHTVAESYGLFSEQADAVGSASDYANVTSLAQAKRRSALMEIREAQIPWWTESEKDSAWKTALMLRNMGHPDSLDPAMVKDSFRIDYKPITFVDAPQTRLAVYRDKIKLGMMSNVDAIMEENPSLTRNEAMDRATQVLEDRTWYEGELAARNLSRDPEEQTMNIAQLQGRIGGQAGGNPTAPDGEEAATNE